MNDRSGSAAPPGGRAAQAPVPLRIRGASIRDLDTLAALEAGAFAEPWTPDQIAGFWEAPGALGWLAEATAGDAVGFALFREVAGEAELLRVATAPAWRRRQVGRSLLAAALAGLDRSGVRCHLEVRADNLAAQALYQGFGFALAGLRRRYYRDDCDAWLFAREPGSLGGERRL